MRFVQIGREVVPRLLSNRTEKGIIVDIKSDIFVIVMKQDKSREIVRLKDLKLTDRVYSREEMADDGCEFYRVPEAPAQTSDFDRFIDSLKSKIAADLIRENGL